MNCRRIEELIPLYVEGDLDVGKTEAVLLHTQTCVSCKELLAGYEESQRWLRSYTPPEFDDASLNNFKQGVLREIDARKAHATFLQSAFLQSLAAHWNRRLVFAASAVFLIMLGALAFYVYQRKANEAGTNNDMAASNEQEKPATEILQQAKDVEEAPRTTFNRKRHPRARRVPRRDVVARGLVNRRPSVERPDLKNVEQARAREIEDKLSGEAETSKGVLRIEIQTSDPLIRIIWFSPKENNSEPSKPITETE